MKRSAVLLVSLLVGATALAFVPLIRCPDCLGVTVIDPDCPRCGDAKKVSAFNRVSRRDLDPDVAILISEPWMSLGSSGESPVPAAVDRLAERSGLSTRLHGDWIGSAIFARDGDERPVLVTLRPTLLPAGPSTDLVLLLGRDGRILDWLLVSGADGTLDLEADIMRGEVRVHAPFSNRTHRFGVQHPGFEVLQGRRLTIRARGGRLEVEAETETDP